MPEGSVAFVCVCVCGWSQEKAELLRRWISAGENLAACESTITAARRNNLKGKRVVKKIAVKDMRVAPYNFSEILIGN